MKILLFGRNGQVGWELQRALAPLGELHALGSDAVDFAEPESLAASVRAFGPDVVVNAAAHTAVDRAEAEPERALRINAEAPAVLAREAAAAGAWLVHYSTDYVFDGSGSAPWTEQDRPAPLSVYGRSKLEGEELVRASGCRHLIFRTSWVYSARGVNFARTMLRLAREREALRVVDDQWGCPTAASDLAKAIQVIGLRLLDGDRRAGGLFNFSGASEMSWHGFTEKLLAAAASLGLKPPALQTMSTAELKAPARRPAYSVLSCARIEQACGLSGAPIEHDVERMVRRILAA